MYVNKQLMALCVIAMAVQGCASVDRRAIPVVDSGAPVSEQTVARQAYQPAGAAPAPAGQTADSGVMVMVPPGNSAPLQTFAAPDAGIVGTVDSTPGAAPQWDSAAGAVGTPSMGTPMPAAPAPAPTGVPSSGGLSADEQLDGPVLALLTTARQQQSGGDLNGAASSLERAQRIAPREPQVLYRLAQVRLEQGDAVQAEQLSRRALSYASGRPALQASLWEMIAQARERQGDAAGAAAARQRAKVSL